MDSQITVEFLRAKGFVQVEGAPESVMTNGILRVWPEYKDRLGDAGWEFEPGERYWIESVPRQLKPRTNEQLEKLLEYIEFVKVDFHQKP